MKKLLLVLGLTMCLNVNAQIDEARDEMLGRADMITFSAGITYVTSFSFTLMESIKDKREVRLGSTLAVGLGIGVLKETADVFCFDQRFNGTDILYCIGGSLIGFALTEMTTAIVDFANKRKKNRVLKL